MSGKSNRSQPPSSSLNWLAPLVLAVAGFVVYANSLQGVFLFDDGPHILSNVRIRRLWPPEYLSASRRPLVDLTLALNYALGKLRPWGYHLFNVVVHVLAALVLYGVMNQALRRTAGAAGPSSASGSLALVVALLWEIHPLQTQSVTYVIQRAESMMGLFYLLCIYCVLRGAESRRSALWYAASLGSFTAGLGCKIVAITAPLMVLLCDVCIIGGSFHGAWRRRWRLYLCMVLVAVLVGVSPLARGVFDVTNTGATVGFGFPDISPIRYALTQPGVLLRYLSLALWPAPLCLDYRWEVAAGWAEMAPQLLVIATMFVIGLWLMFRGTLLGLCMMSFVLILGPTSSVVPIKDVLFEHRLYLPLGGVVTAVTVCGYLWLQRAMSAVEVQPFAKRVVLVGVTSVAILGLSVATTVRNRTYASAVGMWEDVIQKRPDNARAFEQLGTSLVMAGRHGEAIRAYDRAVEIDPAFASAHGNLATALLQTGRTADAARAYERALQLQPEDIHARINRAVALEKLGRRGEAIAEYTAATQVSDARTTPEERARAFYNLGVAHAREQEYAASERAFREAVRLLPNYEAAHASLARLLGLAGRKDEAVEGYRRVLEINPANVEAREALHRLKAPPDRP